MLAPLAFRGNIKVRVAGDLSKHVQGDHYRILVQTTRPSGNVRLRSVS